MEANTDPPYSGPERRGWTSDLTAVEINTLHSRLSAQDKILLEMRDAMVGHIAEERDIGPALRELVSLWRASKLLGVVATGLAAGVASIWAAYSWLREHGLRL